MEFPPLFFLALRFLAIALLLIPFVKRPTRQQFDPIAAISGFLGGLNFGLFYVGLGLGSGSMSAVAYQLATPFTVLLAWPAKIPRQTWKCQRVGYHETPSIVLENQDHDRHGWPSSQ
jgi:drug/metabolite transporter (DMT)-like permease